MSPPKIMWVLKVVEISIQRKNVKNQEDKIQDYRQWKMMWVLSIISRSINQELISLHYNLLCETALEHPESYMNNLKDIHCRFSK